MQTTSPIRRYVLLRQTGQDATASRWSMERIAPAPRGGSADGTSAQNAKSADARA